MGDSQINLKDSMTIYKLLEVKVDLNWVFKKLTSYSDLWMYNFYFYLISILLCLAVSLQSLKIHLQSHYCNIKKYNEQFIYNQKWHQLSDFSFVAFVVKPSQSPKP